MLGWSPGDNVPYEPVDATRSRCLWIELMNDHMRNDTIQGHGISSDDIRVLRSRFGPLRLDPLDLPAASQRIVALAHAEIPSVVVTPNIHHLRLARSDPRFAAVMERAEVSVADGWPIVVGLRALGVRLPGRVAGIDLVADVLATTVGLRVAILGGTLPTAAQSLASRALRSHVVAFIDPLQGGWEKPAPVSTMKRDLTSARANLVVLGIGAPKQELLADALRDWVAGPIICCGAAIDVLAGEVPRAPSGLRRLGLEWAFRLLREPARLGPRYVRALAAFTGTFAEELVARAR